MTLYRQGNNHTDDFHVQLTNRRGDYVHASYVSGYDRPRQYLLAQAPFQADTELDFWRLVAQVKYTVVIINHH